MDKDGARLAKVEVPLDARSSEIYSTRQFS